MVAVEEQAGRMTCYSCGYYKRVPKYHTDRGTVYEWRCILEDDGGKCPWKDESLEEEP
jgi:hypothetical protein